jgi:hypothetical protein
MCAPPHHLPENLCRSHAPRHDRVAGWPIRSLQPKFNQAGHRLMLIENARVQFESGSCEADTFTRFIYSLEQLGGNAYYSVDKSQWNDERAALPFAWDSETNIERFTPMPRAAGIVPHKPRKCTAGGVIDHGHQIHLLAAPFGPVVFTGVPLD